MMDSTDKKITAEKIVTIVDGLVNNNIDGILDAYSKVDDTLAVNIRFSLKGNDEKISITSTLSYAAEKVKDHKNGTIDVRQGTFQFDKKKDDEEDLDDEEEFQESMVGSTEE